MTASTTMPVSRALTLVAGTVLGAACAYYAYSNGVKSAPGFDGQVAGAVGASVTILSWFCLPLAAHAALNGEHGRAWAARAGWVLLTLFVLMNAIGFTAFHRKERVGGNEVAISAYDRAESGLRSAEADLDVARQAKKWASTKGCTVTLTLEDSKTFCGNVTVIKSNIATYRDALNKGRPATADAQAEAFAPLGFDAKRVADWNPILWALVQELAMSLAFYLGLRPGRKEEVAAVVEPVTVSPEAVIPATEPVATAPDLSPLLSLLSAAQAEVEAARFAYFNAMLEGVTLAWAQEAAAIVEPATETVPLPVAVKKAKKAQRKVVAPRKVRDANGRFAKKAKLVSVEANPKPRLSDLPTLGGTENVVILGGPKKKK